MTLRELLEDVIRSSSEKRCFPLWNLLSGYEKRAENLFRTIRDIEIVEKNEIPASEEIPFENPKKWLRISKVACLFVDMTNSSVLDYKNHAKRVAQIYEAFTTPLVRLMSVFGASYIDIKGDGAFGLFDDENGCVRAVLAATTFRKYFEDSVSERIEEKTNGKVTVGFRAGLTYGSVIFKRIGLRGDKKNEVWTNSTVNSCVKLTSRANMNRLIASIEAFSQLREHEALVKSCGCGSNGQKSDLWDDIPVGLDEIGINSAKELRSSWCDTHGEEYLNCILRDFGIELR